VVDLVVFLQLSLYAEQDISVSIFTRIRLHCSDFGLVYNKPVNIYERRDFKVEVGASISCAANGTRWLREWAIDTTPGKPINLVSFRFLLSLDRLIN